MKIYNTVPLYTLAGFYICSPLQCFPLISLYNFHISKISLLSFSVSINHIFHIFHRLDRFFRFFFSNVLSSGFSTLCLPISFQLSSLSVSYHIFPIRGQLFHSYFFFFFGRCHISNFPIFLTVSLLSFSNFFTDSYRIFPIRYL